MALVLFEQRDHIALLTLNRVSMHNALIPELFDELLELLRHLAKDDGIHAVVLQSAAPVFSIGGDMRRFQQEMQNGNISTYASHLVGQLNLTILTMLQLPQPVVVAVNGVVTGGSIGFLLGADIVLFSPGVVVKAHYATAGFAPDGGWTAILPRLIGNNRTSSCLLLNSSIAAQQALDWGIANQIIPAENLTESAWGVAQKIANYPPDSMRATKRLLQAELPTIAAALELERQQFLSVIMDKRAAQGVHDFLKNFSDYPIGDYLRSGQPN